MRAAHPRPRSPSRARRRCATHRAAQAVGEGQPRAARHAVRLRPARRQDAAAHLHEQGSRDGRLRRRRRRLWLQLTTAARAEAPRARRARRSARRSVRCSPPRSRCRASCRPTAHAQSVPDKGIFELQYLSYRDWQPGRNRMTVDAPGVLRADADRRHVGGRRRHGVRRDVGRVAAVLQRAVRRVDRRLPHRRRRQGHEVRRRPRGERRRASCRRSRTSCRAAARSTCSIFSDDRNRTWLLGVAGTNDRINATNGVAPNSKRNSIEFVVGVTQALSPNDIVQSNLTYYTGHGYYSDPYKPLDTRPTDARDAGRGSRATTTTSRSRTRRCSSAIGCCSIRSAARRTRSRSAWVQALPWTASR